MRTSPRRDLEAALAILDQVLPACTALAGYSFDDMTRDDAWRFLDGAPAGADGIHLIDGCPGPRRPRRNARQR